MVGQIRGDRKKICGQFMCVPYQSQTKTPALAELGGASYSRSVFLRISSHFLLHVAVKRGSGNSKSRTDFFHSGFAIVIQRLGYGDLL